MPEFPGLSRMDLVFPGLSSTGKIIKKIQDFQGCYGPCTNTDVTNLYSSAHFRMIAL